MSVKEITQASAVSAVVAVLSTRLSVHKHSRNQAFGVVANVTNAKGMKFIDKWGMDAVVMVLDQLGFESENKPINF
jgi:collagenase-like PrtC family protease